MLGRRLNYIRRIGEDGEGKIWSVAILLAIPLDYCLYPYFNSSFDSTLPPVHFSFLPVTCYILLFPYVK